MRRGFVTSDIDSGRITNIGILDFRERVELLRKVLNKFNIAFPLEISLFG